MKHPHDKISIPSQPLEGIDSSSQEVLQAFRRAMHGYRHLMHKLFADRGTHPGQAAALRVLALREGISQRDLADALHVSAPTVTALLQKLEKAGLVNRETDEEDQRISRLFLTGEGRDACAEVRATFIELMKAGVGPMSEKDRREFARLLDQFGENISRTV